MGSPVHELIWICRVGRRRLAVAISLCVVVLVVGCGDGGESSGATGPGGEISKTEYIKEADETCAKENQQIQQALTPYYEKGVTGDSQVAVAKEMVHKVLAPRAMYEIRSIRSIVLPVSDVEQVLQVLASMQTVVEGAEKDPVAFVHAERPFAKSERLGAEYGFRVCGGL